MFRIKDFDMVRLFWIIQVGMILITQVVKTGKNFLAVLRDVMMEQKEWVKVVVRESFHTLSLVLLRCEDYRKDQRGS